MPDAQHDTQQDVPHGLVPTYVKPPAGSTNSHALIKLADGYEPWSRKRALALANTLGCYLDGGGIEVCEPDELACGLVVRVITPLSWALLPRCLNGAFMADYTANAYQAVIEQRTATQPRTKRQQPALGRR